MAAHIVATLREHWLTALAVVSLAGVLLAVDPRQVWTAIDRVRLSILLLMAAATVGSYASRALAWSAALRRAGARTPLPAVVRVEFAGQALILMPAADLARATLLRRISAPERQLGGGAVVATIVLQELAFIWLLTLSALPQALLSGGAALLLVLGQLAAMTGVGACVVSEDLYSSLVRILESVGPLRRWDRQLRSLRPGLLSLFDIRTLAQVAFWQALAVGLALAVFYLALTAVGASGVSAPAAAYALAIGTIFSGLSVVPLGLGIFEGVVTLLLASTGVRPAEAAAAGLLFRTFNDVLMAGLGALVAVRGLRGARIRSRVGASR